MRKEDTFLILKYGGVENAYRKYMDGRMGVVVLPIEDQENLHKFFRGMDDLKRIELYYRTRDEGIEND